MHVSERKRADAARRRAEIYRYVRDNPGVTPGQIKDYFGLARSTVTAHLKAIRDGWRPGDEV